MRHKSELPNEPGIYVIVCAVNGKIYVGGTKNIRTRWAKHKYGLRNNIHANPFLQDAWNKHGESAFTFSILEICIKDQVKRREQYYLDTLKPFGEKGFNVGTDAIGSMKGRVLSQEARDHLSAINMGNKLTPEHVAKLIAANTGSKRSLESCDRISNARTRHTYSATSPDGEYTANIGNISEFARKHGLTHSGILAVARGVQYHHKGWKFTRATKERA